MNRTVLERAAQATGAQAGDPAIAVFVSWLRRLAWHEFDQLNARGLFTRKILFFKIDLSDEIAELVESIVGPRDGSIGAA